MKTFVKKINTAVALTAVFLLATVGISAQTYQDDVYYSPSKATSSKAKKTKDVKKEVNKTYRTNDKVEDFSTAQQRYAKMLKEKQKDSKQAEAYDETESWVYSTQGLTPKQEINKEVSLYNKGNVSADNPNADSYYDKDYVLWQPAKVTRIYMRPRWCSSFYFGFNYGWGGIYHNPYYNPYYWDYYPYWGHPYYSYHYAPYYYNNWHTPYWRHHYYYGYDRYYNDNYYRNHYYSYRQRPQEYSHANRNTYRRNAVLKQRQNVVKPDNQSVRSGQRNTRYSATTYRRKPATNTHKLPNSGFKKEVSRANSQKTAPSTTRRTYNNVVHQGKAPYTRRIENSKTNYRRSTSTPRRNTQIYRRTTNTKMKNSTPTIYRRTTTPRRTNSSGTYRRSTSQPNRTSYRTPARTSSSTRSSSPSSTSRRSTPSRSSLDSRNRR